MLSTLRITARLSHRHRGLVAVAAQASTRYNNNNNFHYPMNTRRLHEERNSAPNIQDYEPYSKLPYYDGKKGHLMYVGNMTKMVKGIKMFSISTSLVSIGSIPLIRSAIEESMTKAGVMGSISLLIFFTPLLLHFVTKKYVTDIYFNADTEMFTLATKSLLLRRKEVQFFATDVEVPFVGGAFVTHRVKKKPVFIERELFFNKDVYIKMVGYDKPLNASSDDSNMDRDHTEVVKDASRSRTSEEFGFSDNTVSDKTIKTGENVDAESGENVEKGDRKFGLFNEKN